MVASSFSSSAAMETVEVDAESCEDDTDDSSKDIMEDRLLLDETSKSYSKVQLLESDSSSRS